jgi:hypothetical protein
VGEAAKLEAFPAPAASSPTSPDFGGKKVSALFLMLLRRGLCGRCNQTNWVAEPGNMLSFR